MPPLAPPTGSPNVAVSAVSQQLAQLERDVGAKLFERFGRRVQLTELGLLLTEHAEEILGSVERATLALEEAQETVSVRLMAGVWASVASGLLPHALAALAGDHPGIEVRTRELAPEDTADAVRDGELDLSFVIDYSDAPMPWDAGLERAGSRPAVLRCRNWPNTRGSSRVQRVISAGRCGRRVIATGSHL